MSGSALVPAILAILAAIFAYQALQDRSAVTTIVVAKSSIAAGAPVSWSDIRLVQVHRSDTAQTRGLLAPAALASPWLAVVSLQPGEPITVSELSSPKERMPLGEMSIAVPQDQAVGGEIAAGDRVDVIQTTSAGGARYIAQGLRVVSVPSVASPGGVLGGGTTNYFIVVAVNKTTALRVAAALSQSNGVSGAPMEVVRSNGEAPSRAAYLGDNTASASGTVVNKP